jgi:signal transduction histidine kinase
LITIAVWLLLKYIKEIKQERIKLLKINKELTEANHQVKESVNHIMELYQTVHLCSNMKNRNEIIELILEYTRRIITTDMIIFYSYEKKENVVKTASRDECKEIADQLQIKVSKIWYDLENCNASIQLNIEDKCFLVICVKSSYMTYGILCVQIKPNKESFNQIESMDQIKFIADLSSIVLENFELEKVNDKLIITEEQNRIANEIHDSVLQRLFSTSFGIYGLMKKLNKANIKDADVDLSIIRESVDHAMKELRTAIYGLSWKKDGTDNFIIDMANYINDIKKMSNIDINLNIIGNSEHIACMSKKAIYRIVCEGIGNAVRHGKANNIEVSLNIKTDSTQLRIVDDGEGFDFDTASKSNQGGLGISNIRFLVGSLKGKTDYQSTIGKGTIINIIIPNHINDVRGDEVV